MQECQAGVAGDLMAAWRATGGAFEALTTRPETADDGLAATAMTDVYRCADDGLAATAHSHRWPYCADDGLGASGGTFRPPLCIAD